MKLEVIPMQKNCAFSLVELVIALGIILTLATIAYPTYEGYMARSYRQNAQIQLLKLAQNLEIYHGENQSYVGYVQTVQSKHYDIKIAGASEENYSLEAIPDLVQAKRDKLCGSLNLDNTGKRSISGNGNLAQCW